MKSFYLAFVVVGIIAPVRGSEQTLAARLAPHIKAMEAVASSPEIVKAVVAQNQSRPEGFGVMSEAKWKSLPENHPYVFTFVKSVVGERLRKIQGSIVSEAFVNDADGYKVGFLKKTTFWNHKGKAKHDEPMRGKIWFGPIEMDASSSTKQVQIGLPIWSEGKVVGSLVVGFNVFQLAAEQ